MATGTVNNAVKSWALFDKYDVTTNTQTISSIPIGVKELLIILGSKNNAQVYGGVSVIIPAYERGLNIINTGTLYSGNGALLSQKGAYLYWKSATELDYKALDITSGNALLMRVYYR